MEKYETRREREYSSTFNRLTVDGFVPEQNLQFRSKVAVCEKGKRYALATAEGQDSVVYAVDGYIVKDGLRCDKLVLVRRTQEGRIPYNCSQIFVEYKGNDVQKSIARAGGEAIITYYTKSSHSNINL